MQRATHCKSTVQHLWSACAVTVREIKQFTKTLSLVIHSVHIEWGFMSCHLNIEDTQFLYGWFYDRFHVSFYVKWIFFFFFFLGLQTNVIKILREMQHVQTVKTYFFIQWLPLWRLQREAAGCEKLCQTLSLLPTWCVDNLMEFPS